ncbi:MAG TPA: radical SAM protein [Methanocorpusculum sp.]|nr:radical SAM protein [Methanocorpusculum sp.]
MEKQEINVAIINLTLRLGAKLRYLPMGLGYVMTAVRDAGYKFDFIDQDIYAYTQDEVIDLLQKNKKEYDIILMGSIVTGYRLVKSMVSKLKQAFPNGLVCVGNSVASSIPNELLTYTDTDIAVLGEGDVTVVKILDALSQGTPLSDVAGIAFKDSQGEIHFTKPRPAEPDISKFYVDFALFDMEKYIPFMTESIKPPMPPVDPLRVTTINTARGCVNKCSFCYQVFRDERYRRRSMESIMREIQKVIEEYHVNYISFKDDLTFYSKKVLEEFVEWKEKLGLEFYWEGLIRGDMFYNEDEDMELLLRLKDNGCWVLFYSLESSNPEILKAMRKHVDVEQFKKQTHIIQKAGINVATSLIFGYPQETLETIADSFDVCMSLGIPLSVGYLMPQPKTEVFDYAVKNGYITDIEKYLLSMGDRQDFRINISKIPDDVLVKTVEENVRRCHRVVQVESFVDNFFNFDSDQGGDTVYTSSSSEKERKKE